MSESFKNMTDDELEKYINDCLDDEAGELAFLEYSSRLDWKKVPAGATPEEEKQIIEDLIAQRTKK
ncbi:MAG: hypothetical protein QNJ41_02535 [Xenococcaceae cyanobacterium MO_188.B32]|nr:hypothetical protein [Xenococcaceae cyanobacterium MO_188.B32]